MKYYQIVIIRGNDEFTEWEGANYETACKMKEKALNAYDSLTAYDQKDSTLECRVYDLPDDIDINDEDAVFDAICDCIGYDNF